MRIAKLFFSLFLAVAFPVAGGLGSPGNAPQSDQNVRVIEVSAKKYEFNPSPIHIKLGTKVQLKLTATDHAHGFKIGEFPDGSDKKGNPGLAFTSRQDCWKIEKGESVTIEFVAQTPGTYSFKCCVRCGLDHGRMKSELIVDP
jgi:cytochrome c oxidase subunit 2